MATILITGANRGIGLALAAQFAARGDEVIGTARNPESAHDLAAIAEVQLCDVADDASVSALGARLSGRTIDLLVNNAGILEIDDLDSASSASMIRQFNVNAVGPLRVTQALRPNLSLSDAPKVACVTSRMGSIADNSSGRFYGYRTSKAALNMVGKSLSLELAPTPVVLLHPGMVKTDMVGGNGDVTAEEAATKLIAIIDRVGPAESGQFLHRDDYELPW